MSLLTRKRVILAKTESVYGTDPTPTGAANAMLVRNLEFTPLEAELVSRDLIRNYFGNSDTIVAQTAARVQFEVELAGSGAAGTAPAWGPLLKACGFDETIVASTSVTYEPISASIPSLTIYVHNDGVLHKVKGARGSVQLSMIVKQLPVLRFNFLGLYSTPTDTALPTTDFSDFQIPKIANTGNTPSFELHSYAGFAESIELDMACDVQYRTLIGYQAVELIDRKPSGSIVIEAPAMASKNYFSVAEAGTTGNLEVVHGTVAGNIVTVTAPRVSIGNPNYQDSQGVQMLSIPFVPSPDAGDDEISIALT